MIFTKPEIVKVVSEKLESKDIVAYGPECCDCNAWPGCPCCYKG